MHRGRARRRGRFQISEFSFKHVGRSQLLGNTPQHHRFSGLDCSRFADDERSEPKPVAEPQPNTAVQKLTLARLRSLGLEPLRGSYRLHSAKGKRVGVLAYRRLRRRVFATCGTVGTRSRAIRSGTSDDRVGCSASDGRCAPARPALHGSTRLLPLLPCALASADGIRPFP